MTPNLTHIATAYSVSEAHIIQSMLRSYGIGAEAFDLHTVNLDPGLMIALGGIRIFVASEDAEDAKTLVWEGQQQAIPPRSYDKHPVKNGLWAIILTLMGAPPPARVPLQKD